MSVVSGVTLTVSCAEDAYKNGKTLIEQVNKWLAARNFGPLVQVDQHYGGSKHPQVHVYGAGFNYFPANEFAKFAMALRWDYSENVVLLIQPEEGGTKVFRPS